MVAVSFFTSKVFRGAVEPVPFTGTVCRRLRMAWGIKMAEISSRAMVHHSIAVRWEKMPADDSRHPFPFAADLANALAERITERALRQIEAFPPVLPSDRDRLRAVVARMNKEDGRG